ncbi:hypothetical protein AGMMS49982_13780 [Bacteroidia bacterium]|nr:hypothetical protein AGMMS49982_13780 [Bacteroidia bacterium]
MKKYIFLFGMVALMSSCNGDIYDNIKEFVDSETVYPAGYDQTKVSLLSGYDRVEIYLMGDNREDNPYLAKAIKTVVKWGDGPNDTVSFTPARSWVNVTGLTVAQVYHFQVYTEDEFGNISTPVTISGKPFTEADKGTLIVTNIMASANASRAVITPTTAPESYTITGSICNFNIGGTVRSDTFTGSRILLENLLAGETYTVHTTFGLLPVGALDTIPVTYDVEVRTMSTTEWNDYFDQSQWFPLADTFMTSTQPFIIKAADFDLGGEGKGFHRGRTDGGVLTYRPTGGDENRYYGIEASASSAGLVGIGWVTVGDWYAYTVEVKDPGVYKLEYNRSASNDISQATLLLDALDVCGIIPIVRSTANWQWYDPNISIRFSAGKHKLRWTQLGSGYNYGGLRFTYQGPL